MSRAPSLCGIVLAAGASTRMGRDKALLPWPPAAEGQEPSMGGTFLSESIRSLSPFNDMVIVVVGNNEANLAPLIYAAGAFLVRNLEPERGQFSSLQAGLREVLNRGRDAAMITHVDRPSLSGNTLQDLRASFQAAVAVGNWAVVPEYQGRHGHPILAG